MTDKEILKRYPKEITESVKYLRDELEDKMMNTENPLQCVTHFLIDRIAIMQIKIILLEINLHHATGPFRRIG